MMTSGTTRLFVGAIVSFALASGAQAQIGGLIKKKVAETVKGPEKTQAKPADANPKSIYHDDVIEMTEPVLDGFANGLRTEIALRSKFRELLSKLKTPAQYQACTDAAAASPDGQKISTRILELPEKVSAEEMQRVIQKAGEDLVALQERKCGKDPAVEWSDERRAEKLMEIELKAAEAVPVPPSPKDRDPGSAESEGGPFDSSASLLDLAAEFRGSADFEFQAIPSLLRRVYAMLKERTPMFCDAQLKGTVEVDSKGDVRIPGIGVKIFGFFSAVEAMALKVRCDVLLSLLEKLDGLVNQVGKMK